jgi:hypothetical protein
MAKAKNPGSPGDQIYTKVSLLVFLGVFLMGLGANLDLWSAVTRAFFVWLVVSLLGGAVRVGWKYHLYQQREHELHANLNRAKQHEEQLLEERRQKREQAAEQMSVLMDVVDGDHRVRGDNTAEAK